MSVQTLYTAATGMESLQTKLDVIANNLANINTTGFKKGRANFEDLFYQHDKQPGAQDAASQQTPTGISIGLGSRVQSVQTSFQQGSFATTNAPLDVAIQGPGFFWVQNPDGTNAYTRAGNFSVNAQNNLVIGSAQTGRLLQPSVQIPLGSTDVTVTQDGRVLAKQPGSSQLQQVGQLQLASFVNPEGLLKMGENLYMETDASGTATPGNPQQNGLGSLQQGALELSNVEPVQELIDLITTQRSFELNSQTVQAGDQILQLISNLRR